MNPLPLVAILMVFSGIFLLLLSLIPTIELCRKDNNFYLSWRILLVLIVLFIVGYISFLKVIFHSFITDMHMIVAAILFGGSIFVIIVVRLCLASIMTSEHMALHDSLTGLPNRALLEDRIDHCLKVAKRHEKPLAFLLLDLVRFKEINDSYGHFYGDYILQEVAHRMKGVVRESDTLARFGGDEFAMLLFENDQEQAEMMSNRIASVLDRPFMIEGTNFKVSVSIGIAMFPDHASDTDTLMVRADEAMYGAKRNEKVYTVFDPDLIKADGKS